MPNIIEDIAAPKTHPKRNEILILMNLIIAFIYLNKLLSAIITVATGILGSCTIETLNS